MRCEEDRAESGRRQDEIYGVTGENPDIGPKRGQRAARENLREHQQHRRSRREAHRSLVDDEDYPRLPSHSAELSYRDIEGD